MKGQRHRWIDAAQELLNVPTQRKDKDALRDFGQVMIRLNADSENSTKGNLGLTALEFLQEGNAKVTLSFEVSITAVQNKLR